MRTKLIIMAVLVAVFGLVYLFYGLNFKFFEFSMSLRIPKFLAMLLVAYCIGAATLIFQTIIKNTIVTPCLLGMNSLYLLIHTAVMFFLGSASVFVLNKFASFMLDLVLMGSIATFLYSYLFRVTGHNVLYVLLTGTVMATLFSSLQNSMVRVMDPNEYDALLSSLVASFNNVNSDILGFAFIVAFVLSIVFYKDLKLLDAISLGKEMAINLGIDYDKVTKRLLLGVALFIAVATALVGPISFLGLIIANLSRQFFNTYRHSYLIAGSIFFGMIVLIVGQVIVERVFVLSVPISVFISIMGGGYFMYLLVVNRSRI
ncbi:iron chelate uptake ABC transporter family permease subunit [Campylobacter corcagiensis]|uniref:Iron chelate uptake ABC transporter family permease subunit n=1 Tax=Campylobacter corcagiensis TaxID=1448857 RepID=A0A7M1LJV2_9BACT|nr:iron chelate uptake ABC transporter family permease subunit [Campylobacter corcagiensis]QKF65332.1 enterochelin ABC transporter CeuBCDE, permease protein [Campylobacter corcagiensis]QOQ88086.1 iron chelate uptake ABC transporter family permease subunit [Campylobacter corcagiensis]